MPPLPCPLSLESAGELLDLGTADRPLPALRLEVDRVESEAIFLNDPVDPSSPDRPIALPASSIDPPEPIETSSCTTSRSNNVGEAFTRSNLRLTELSLPCQD